VVRPRGTVVLVGVSTPAQHLEGKTAHAVEHYLSLLDEKRIAPQGVLTHRFGLQGYKDAFLTARSKGSSPAVKVAFQMDGAS
jgi:threonine dehydrogenase-like Zn-dependent dehydrogenase